MARAFGVSGEVTGFGNSDDTEQRQTVRYLHCTSRKTGDWLRKLMSSRIVATRDEFDRRAARQVGGPSGPRRPRRASQSKHAVDSAAPFSLFAARRTVGQVILPAAG